MPSPGWMKSGRIQRPDNRVKSSSFPDMPARMFVSKNDGWFEPAVTIILLLSCSVSAAGQPSFEHPETCLETGPGNCLGALGRGPSFHLPLSCCPYSQAPTLVMVAADSFLRPGRSLP